MPASAFLLGASVAARIASLNLCTDEYLLLLARPQQVVSVSYLSQDPLESPLWQKARRYKGNRGSIEDVLTLRPRLVLTMGGGGRATSLLARRLGLQVRDLPYAMSLADVEQNLRTVAAAVGEPHRAEPWVARIEQLRRSAPHHASDTIWLSGRGDSLGGGSLGSEWLRLAGYQQRSLPGGHASFEALLTKPAKVLIVSNYRAGQMSAGARWLQHPIIRSLPSRRLVTDGRRWTCLGPLMIPEIERLKALAR